MKLKLFALALLLAFLPLLPSFSEEGAKIWITNQEYDQIIQNMMIAQKESIQLKADAEELKTQLQEQSKYWKTQNEEAKKKNKIFAVIGFTGGVLFTSGFFLYLNK